MAPADAEPRRSVIEHAYTKTPFDTNFLEPDAKLYAYRDVRAAVNKRVKEVMETAVGPGVVAETILKAVRAVDPKIRYSTGRLAHWDSHSLFSLTTHFGSMERDSI